jgi:hypothetical protein
VSARRLPAGWLRAMGALAAAAGAFFLAHCTDDSTGVHVLNQAPSVRITGGPSGDSLHLYRVTFQWSAEDDDGLVSDYEYALDDTTVADSVVSTTVTSATLVFTADDFKDTVIEILDGRPVELQRFGRSHVFFVRARDDAGAWSPFAFAAFFAITVAPTSTFTNPLPGDVATVGPRFEATWTGEDLDGREPPRLFATRIVSVPAESLLTVPVSRLDVPGAGPPWTAFTEHTAQRFEIDEGDYLVGVRAMDEAGAVEPILRASQNVLRLRVRSTPGTPIVHLSGPGKVVILPSADEEAKTFDLISNRSAQFNWSADASGYGARITGYAYGVDLESVDPNDPGWIPVANPAISVQLSNPAGVEQTLHTFHLRIQDSIDQVTVVDAILRVGPPDFTRDILIIDDWGGDQAGSPSNPQDAEHDRFLREVLLAEATRRGLTIDEVEFTDPQGRPVPDTPNITQMRRYKLLVWNIQGSVLGITRAVAPTSDLPVHTYLSLGGNIWFMGEEVLTRTIALMPLPELFGFTPGDLGYDFFGIKTRRSGSQIEAGGFLRPRGNLADQRVDGMDGANPTAPAAVEGWPALLVAKDPYTSPVQGIPRIEGMTIGYPQLPEEVGRVDTLYTYVTNGSRLQPFPVRSRMDNTPCAFRFSGDPEQGKVLVFTFPVYWWSDGAADSLGQRAIDWFWRDRR